LMGMGTLSTTNENVFSTAITKSIPPEKQSQAGDGVTTNAGTHVNDISKSSMTNETVKFPNFPSGNNT